MDWQTRAEAAEKAVVVLKQKVRQIYDGEPTSHLQRQLERSRRRSEEVLRRRELAEVKNRELLRHLNALEQEVRNRTADLRNILDHVASGFLLIDAGLCVQPGFSKSCEELLGTAALAGVPLAQVLGATPDRAAWLHLAVAQAFADELPEDVVLAQIPMRHHVGGRALCLTPRLVRDGGRVAHILITLTDVTALEMAEAEARIHRVLVNILSHREAFAPFIEEARASLASARQAQAQEVLRRIVHTVKGNAAAWGLEAVVDVCHEVEGHDALGAGELDRVEGAFRSFLEQHRSVLTVEWDPVAAVSAADEAGSTASDRRTGDGAPADELDRGGHVLKRADELLGPLGSFVERLASRFDKPLDFVLDGGDTLIDARRLRPVIGALPHLLRNAIDHGIEHSDRRRGKPARARVTLRIARDARNWRFALEDDGTGIDTAALRARALELGAVSVDRLATMTEDEALQLMFVDGLSTAAAASDVSGRGVGMPAIRDALERVGGHIEIQTTTGQGTKIALVVPLSEAPAALPA